MNRRTLLVGITTLLAGIAIGHFLTLTFLHTPENSTVEHPIHAESATRAFAKSLVVRLVPFDDGVSLEEAVDYIRARARTGMEIDGMPKPYRLNFVVVDPNKTAKPIKMILYDIRLDQLCERIAQVSGMAVSFDDDAIVFTAIQQSEQAVSGNRR